MGINSHHGLLHLNIRKRIAKREKFPNPDKKLRRLDNLVYTIGIIGPMMALPQIFKIFVLKNAGGVSFITSISFALFSFIWLIYGKAHDVKPIIITQYIWIFLHLSIAIGALIYGTSWW
ncbi:hypothetical protein COU58_04085 [Candidatus Pacearchaeota archaeon CG10_big_fil_rev_8_21_14_0_10_32_42]|nr:MAG: hypothetical protein COU58_04085 [Candidatus Pacearchaeota archaeon CG10_big_fil_rev_8_21_14_0_10_32_42]